MHLSAQWVPYVSGGTLLHPRAQSYLDALMGGTFCIDSHPLAWLRWIWHDSEALDLERVIGLA